MQKPFLTAAPAISWLESKQSCIAIPFEPEVNPVHGSLRKSPGRSLTVTAIASVVVAFHVTAQESSRTLLRIGMVTPDQMASTPAAASIARGVRLGAAESRQTSALFGNDVELFEASGSGAGATSAANRLWSRQKVQVLIGTSPADADALSRFAESRGVIFLNVSSRSQALRAACRRHTFHIEATDTMYANAARLGAGMVSPGRSAGTPTSTPTAESVVLWDQALARFGASEINNRYRGKYQLGMDGGAWAGWVAVKIATEAVLRIRSTSPASIMKYLESPATQFDGHKGWPLTFRMADHQLRQPLYIVAPPSTGTSSRLRDVPDLRAAASRIPADDAGTRGTDRVLDELVEWKGAPSCAWRAR